LLPSYVTEAAGEAAETAARVHELPEVVLLLFTVM
jgi:hypothetical protein